uniref:Arrestin_N domain-containing protein n=1 Tax=Globodera pallida TaxID=36090 RepID=A0A183BQ77_GLOPA
MKLDNFELSFEKPHTQRDFYMAGEEIKGNVGIKVKESIRVARLSLRFLGSVHTAWKDKFTSIAYESVELVLDEYRDVTSELSQHCDGIMELFSASEKMDTVGSNTVAWHLWMYRTKEGIANLLQVKKEFAVVSYLNLDAPHFRSPAHSFEQMIVLGIFCGRPRGETYEVTLTVENTLKKGRRKNHLGEGHQCGLISLCQQIDFRAQAKNKPHTWERRSLTTAVQSNVGEWLQRNLDKCNFRAYAKRTVLKDPKPNRHTS